MLLYGGNLKTSCQVKEADYEWPRGVGLHLRELPRMDKSVEAERRLVVPGAGGGGGGRLLMGAGFSRMTEMFCKRQKVEVAKHCECPKCP